MEAYLFGLFDLLPFLNVGVLGVVLDLVVYLGLSLGLFRLAKKLGMDNAWMAWIPVIRLILLGKIADSARQKKGHFYRNGLLVAVLVYVVAALIEKAVFVLGIVLMIPFIAGVVGAYLLWIITLFANVPALMLICGLPLLFSIGALIVFACFWSVVENVASIILLVTAIFYFVMYMVTLSAVYKRHDNKYAILYIILSVLFDVAPSILLPVISYKKPKTPAAEVNEEAPAEITA